MNAGSLLPRLLASFATLAAASSALGQAVTDDDGPVRLSEFRLESVKDRGYVVANSVTATGIATEIRNVPMAINVVTEDFIRDSASFDLKDAVSFAPNVNSNAREPDEDQRPRFRGVDPAGRVRPIGRFVFDRVLGGLH